MAFVPHTDGMYTLGELLNLYKGDEVDPTVVHTILDVQPLFDQAPMLAANNGTNNLTQVITEYPELQSRGYNEGTDPGKMAQNVRTDTCGMFAGYSVIDAKMLAQNGNSATWRAKQENAFIRGYTHGMARRLFQDSSKKDVKSFDGFQVRYNKIGDQVIDFGGTGDSLTDIWLVNWDPALVHLIHPNKGLAGLQTFDRGEQDVYDKNGKRFRGVITDFEWDMGLAIEDPAQVIRIANVDIAALSDYATAPSIINKLIEALERLPEGAGSNAAFYMGQTVRGALRLQINNHPNVQLTQETIAGRLVSAFDGVPIHKMPNSVIGSYATAIK